MTIERRDFQMDPQLLADVIKKQAGSLWKAISEAVMNAADAGGTKCAIVLTRTHLDVSDNGKGFRSRDDIEQYFEVFGKPHAAREQKKFGAFRMGRGQLFAFGCNTWRSGTFEMLIDINRTGLNYKLRQNMTHADGCAIAVALYKTLTNLEYAQMLDAIKSNIKYVALNVTLNGKRCNVDLRKVQWSLETEQAAFLSKPSQDLCIYNQGILVKSFPAYQHGIGGDVVTRVPLGVNFARNDIMDDCPVWKAVLKSLRAYNPNGRRGRGRQQHAMLSEAEIRDFVETIKADRANWIGESDARIFKKHTSRCDCSLITVAKVADGVVTMPPKLRDRMTRWAYDEAAKNLATLDTACALDRIMLTRFGVTTPVDLVEMINKYCAHPRLTYKSWEVLASPLGSECQVIPDAKHNRVESIVIRLLRKYCYMLFYSFPVRRKFQNANHASERKLVLGQGDCDSWTDGTSYIAINRGIVCRHGIQPGAWTTYAHAIMHEALHDDRTDNKHNHRDKFYELHHSWSMTSRLGEFVQNCILDRQK